MIRLRARSPRWAAPLAALGCCRRRDGVHAGQPTRPRARRTRPPTCLLKLTTGFDCPGCGGTRALWYLLHGDLPGRRPPPRAVRVRGALPGLPVRRAGPVKRLFGWRLPQLRLSPVAIGGFLAVWLVFSVLRNLPWAPFTALYV